LIRVIAGTAASQRVATRANMRFMRAITARRCCAFARASGVKAAMAGRGVEAQRRAAAIAAIDALRATAAVCHENARNSA